MGLWSFLRDMFIIDTFAGMCRKGRASNSYDNATLPGDSEPTCCSGSWDGGYYDGNFTEKSSEKSGESFWLVG